MSSDEIELDRDTDGGVSPVRVDLPDPPSNKRSVMAALRDDEPLEQLANVRRALRRVDTDELEPAAETDVRDCLDLIETAWRLQFDRTHERLTLDEDPCPSR